MHGCDTKVIQLEKVPMNSTYLGRPFYVPLGLRPGCLLQWLLHWSHLRRLLRPCPSTLTSVPGALTLALVAVLSGE